MHIVNKLNALHNITINISKNSLDEILEICEKHPSISEFVGLVCDFDEKNILGAVLRKFIWDISRYEISDNPYHAKGTLYNLYYFIGNYFLDDSYFIIKEGKNGYFVAEPSSDDVLESTQDPNALMAAAKLNINKQSKQNKEFHKYINSV